MNRKTEAFKKENLQILFLLLIIFAITILVYFFFSLNNLVKEYQINNTVTKIIDGDTFELASGEKVRLLCVDTAEENQKGYEEAKQFLSTLILNKQVKLEKQTLDRDKYGRLLRWVYVNKTNTNKCNQEENSDPNILSANICFSVGDSEVLVNREIINQKLGTLFVYENENCSLLTN